MLFSILLFFSLLTAFYLLCVPLGEHETSPAISAIDSIKRTVGERFASERMTDILTILGKSYKDMVKTGLLSGLGVAVLCFLLTFKFIGPYSLIASLVSFIVGIFLTEKILENEYRMWQRKILEGVPTLVNFAPAFLEVDGVTPREALSETVNFLPEPLRSEMESLVDTVKRTGRLHQALEDMAQKVNHPLFDAICLRISSSWDSKVTADIFADLSDQIEEMNDLTVTRATTAKTGYLALICVIGLVGMLLIYGYPGMKYLLMKMTGGF
ncbi:MAG: Bacterial type II secretion system protein F domain protein [Pelotomaculum sp. PtaU1.Bin065]|nr:MAG: Bacterial type II secretion system protein F domain protein [Pelotomaculum sp. PtaU1.Bin065]